MATKSRKKPAGLTESDVRKVVLEVLAENRVRPAEGAAAAAPAPEKTAAAPAEEKTETGEPTAASASSAQGIIAAGKGKPGDKARETAIAIATEGSRRVMVALPNWVSVNHITEQLHAAISQAVFDAAKAVLVAPAEKNGNA